MIPLDAATDAASNSPVIIYATIALGLLGLCLSQIPKVAETWTKILEARRRVAIDQDDADIAELKRQVQNLTTWREEQVKRVAEHTDWDRKTYQALLRLGEDVGPPPPLF